ncbi:hypothetical protein [Vibrio sp. Isolate24]|uniref:hypothetical protein n=1 Tax=Vibrio sp. Isolate24 TaxID=2908534 RepID=UPI001EFD28AA|nr:hypothetical protein [Vibrio sp. Isolate24]MCG9680822.1 hypothetical protein [Vibrio sp. Isolate24]
MSIPNHQLKTDNQRLAVLYLVVLSVYGGLFEFCVIVGSRLARALGTVVINALCDFGILEL